MHPSTEDLLTVRDGAPLDAERRAAIEAQPPALREVERLRAMQRGLQALPDLEPPPGLWERVLEAERETRVAPRRWLRGLASLGVAVAVAGGAIIYLANEPAAPDWTAVVPGNVSAPRAGGTDGPYVALPTSYTVLVEESARLEKLLAEMPSPRALIAGSTASTIVGLEDRIAFLDEQLSYGAARGLQVPQRQALWSERVELMNALVHVRFAQAQGNGF